MKSVKPNFTWRSEIELSSSISDKEGGKPRDKTRAVTWVRKGLSEKTRNQRLLKKRIGLNATMIKGSDDDIDLFGRWLVCIIRHYTNENSERKKEDFCREKGLTFIYPSSLSHFQQCQIFLALFPEKILREKKTKPKKKKRQNWWLILQSFFFL